MYITVWFWHPIFENIPNISPIYPLYIPISDKFFRAMWPLWPPFRTLGLGHSKIITKIEEIFHVVFAHNCFLIGNFNIDMNDLTVWHQISHSKFVFEQFQYLFISHSFCSERVSSESPISLYSAFVSLIKKKKLCLESLYIVFVTTNKVDMIDIYAPTWGKVLECAMIFLYFLIYSLSI